MMAKGQLSPLQTGPGSARPAAVGDRFQICPRWLPIVTAGLSLVVFSLGSWKPAYWLDEATTLHAVRRSWRDVVRLFNGDPSLVPYYLVMKPFAAVSESEAWMRLPGIVTMAAAVTILVWGLCRLLGPIPAALAGVIWLSISAFSLYAQMVRPYAFLVLLTVVAAACWWKSLSSDRRWWSVVFGLAFLGIGLVHMYGLLIVLPLLVAGWVAPSGSRRSTILRTLVPAAVATVALSPYLALTALRAPGPARIRELTPANVAETLVDAIGSPWQAIALVILAVAGLALHRTSNPAELRLMTLAGCWAFGLPLILIAAQAVGLRTLMPRYFLFAIPGLVVLAAIGLWRLSRWWAPLGAAGLAAVVALGLPGQIEVRENDGHRAGPVRQVAAAVNVPALASLPVVASPPDLTLRRLAAYAPEVIAERMPWYLDPTRRGRLMLFHLPPADELKASVADVPAVIVVGETSEAMDEKATAKSREVNDALRSVGFATTLVMCRIGHTTVSVEARPGRTAEVPPAPTIIDQIRAAVPTAKCATG